MLRVIGHAERERERERPESVTTQHCEEKPPDRTLNHSPPSCTHSLTFRSCSLSYSHFLSFPGSIIHATCVTIYLCTLYVFSLTFLIFSIRTIFHSPSYLYSVTHLYRIPWHLLRLSSLTVSLNHEVKVGRVVGEEKKSCVPVYSILCIVALTFCTLPQSFCIHYPQCLYQFLFSLSLPLLYTSILLPTPVYFLNYLHCTVPLESVVKISLSFPQFLYSAFPYIFSIFRIVPPYP